eukprot:gene5950-9779_t
MKKVNQNGSHLDSMQTKKLKKVHPIVWFNSLMGVGLDAKLENIRTPSYFCYKNYPWHHSWIDLKLMYFRFTSQCVLNVLTPHYDSKLRRMVNLKGVSIRPRDFGGYASLAHIDVGHYIKYLDVPLKYLEKLGHKPGKTFRSAGFDWRKAPNELLRDGEFYHIKKLIEETFEINGKTKVHIMSHSYGGPVANFFLTCGIVNQAWKDKYIKSFIPYGSPFDGSYVSPLTMILKTDSNAPHITDGFRILARELSSAAWLIPVSDYRKDKVFIETPKRKYKGGEIKEFFEDFDLKATAANFYDNLKYRKDLAPNVPVNCFYGVNLTTVTGFKLNEKGEASILSVEDGDGTVPLRDLQVCDNWATKQDTTKYPVKLFKINNLDHKEVTSESFLNALTEILNQDT